MKDTIGVVWLGGKTILTSSRSVFSWLLSTTHTPQRTEAKCKEEKPHDEDYKNSSKGRRVCLCLSGAVFVGLLGIFLQHAAPSSIVHWLNPSGFASVLSPTNRWLINTSAYTLQLKAHLTKALLIWSVGSWCLLFMATFSPWGQSWNRFVYTAVAREDTVRYGARGDDIRTGEDEEKHGWNMDSSCGSLLLMLYGGGLWCGLWFASMAIHRTVVSAVIWLSRQAYSRAVAVVFARNVSDVFWS